MNIPKFWKVNHCYKFLEIESMLQTLINSIMGSNKHINLIDLKIIWSCYMKSTSGSTMLCKCERCIAELEMPLVNGQGTIVAQNMEKHKGKIFIISFIPFKL